jgi:putative Holliday junction resolvase
VNYLGIDYGTRRIGLSVGDDTLRFAVPIAAIKVNAFDNGIAQIATIVKLRQIQKMIVGYPLNMDGSIGPKAKEIDRFIVLLEKEIGIPAERMDERLTTAAVGDLRQRSPKNRRNMRQKGTVDSAAATLILQDYFDTLEYSA